MRKIGHFLKHNPNYNKLKKPLEAAGICEIARKQSDRYRPISYKNGLLTLAVESSAQAANLQAESLEIIDKINQKIGKRVVERIRFKIN